MPPRHNNTSRPYSLTDKPFDDSQDPANTSIELGYDDIDRALNDFQQRSSPGGMQRYYPGAPLERLPEEDQEYDRQSLPIEQRSQRHNTGNSHDSNSHSSQATYYEEDQEAAFEPTYWKEKFNGGDEDGEEEGDEDEGYDPAGGQHQQSHQYLPPRDNQYLPPVDSGPQINWGDLSQYDPFLNKTPSAPSQSVPTLYYAGSTGNPTRPSSAYTPLSSSYHSAQPSRPPSSVYSVTSTHPSRPNSAFPTTFIPPPDAHNYDPEQGRYSRASYQPPRSRSPTPDVEYDMVPEFDEEADSNPLKRFRKIEEVDLEKTVAPPVSLLPAKSSGSVKEKDDAQSLHSSVSPLVPALSSTQHFGPAPAGRQLRRHKTKKKVPLTKGHLVVHSDVPTKLVLPGPREPEMAQMTYTAVTCDPDDFEKQRFSLRQNAYGRKTELFVVITMFNENEVLFCRSLIGVMKNISHLCSRKASQTWGPDSWKKVVVCIVADGRKFVHPRVLDCLTVLGVYSPADMKRAVNGRPVTAHLFEYTSTFGLDPELKFKYPDKGIVPTQILFCLKEKNAKKINSHRWFFNAFAPLLQPNVCVLLDVGTRPAPKSLYHLWKAFDLNSNVGGACGEIAVYKGKRWKYLLNPLVAAQNFEYKLSNILDKPTESIFGYISVLPGAFSAYRYIALQNNKHGRGPLASYFKGEVLHGRETDIFTSNMYLAEDRILCFELIAKANANWVLKYVKSAMAETDVPDALPEFIGQRRRWLNGSFFAAIYALAHLGQIMRSGHTTKRKVVLAIESLYNAITLVFAWFAIGNFYLFFVILTSSVEDKSFGLPGIKYFNMVVQYCYAAVLASCFLFSMGNRPRASELKYKLATIFFSLLTIYMVVCAVVCTIQAAAQVNTPMYSRMLLSVIVTYGVYFFGSLLAFEPWHLITSFIPYMLLSPCYINILNIYAFSNLDDISWGTKTEGSTVADLPAVFQDSHSLVDLDVVPESLNDGYMEALENLKHRKPVIKPSNGSSNAEKEQAAKDYYADIRTNVLLAWVLSNTLLAVAILSGGGASSTFGGDSAGDRTRAYMVFILAFVAITSSVRFAGSTLYLLARIFTG